MKLQKSPLFLSMLLIFNIVVSVEAKTLKKYKADPPLDFNLNLEAGKPIQVIFKDGREASLMVRESSQVVVEFPTAIEETTCSEHRPKAPCSLHSGIKYIEVALHWTKHPNPKRIGKDVIVAQSKDDKSDNNDKAEKEDTKKEDDGDDDAANEDDKAVDFNDTLNFEYKNFFPDLVKNLSPLQLVCEDFRWLGQESVDAPDLLHIIEWGVEYMLPNRETKVNENRIYSGALDVIMEKKSKNSIQIKEIGNFVAENFFSSTLLSGDIIGWTIKKGDDICQTSLKIDINTATDLFADKIYKARDKATFKPFIYNPQSPLWKYFIAKSVEDDPLFERKMPEPYKTLLILELIETDSSNTTLKDLTWEEEYKITGKNLK